MIHQNQITEIKSQNLKQNISGQKQNFYDHFFFQRSVSKIALHSLVCGKHNMYILKPTANFHRFVALRSISKVSYEKVPKQQSSFALNRLPWPHTLLSNYNGNNLTQAIL